MAVTESNLDPEVLKMSIIFNARAVSWECGHVTEMLLILKKVLKYERPKKCPMILLGVNLWTKPVSATGAILTPPFCGIPNRAVDRTIK